MVNRKHFIHLASMSIGSLVIPNVLLSNSTDQSTGQKNAAMQALAQEALTAARLKGASYADVRISNRSQPSVSVRVLVNGAWGFAGADAITSEAAGECVQKALAAAVESKQKPARSKRFQYDLKKPYDVWMCAFLRK
jgi:TldD protein